MSLRKQSRVQNRVCEWLVLVSLPDKGALCGAAGDDRVTKLGQLWRAGKEGM